MAGHRQRGMLEIRQLDFGLLDPVELAIDAGECVALWGPSGSGKTRLLRAVADLDPHDGEVYLEGEPRGAVPAHRWRQRVALLPAETAWWHDTVGPHLENVPTAWLEALGFAAEVFDWRVSRLSTGERQRLGLLRLLGIAPRVLLLDEPTANLDDATTVRAERFVLERLREGLAILWVSHDPEQRQRVAHRQYEILGRRLERAGDPA